MNQHLESFRSEWLNELTQQTKPDPNEKRCQVPSEVCSKAKKKLHELNAIEIKPLVIKRKNYDSKSSSVEPKLLKRDCDRILDIFLADLVCDI